MDIPKHLEGNTSLIWMHQRRSGNTDWVMTGLKYITTDENGLYKQHQLEKAFELHVQEKQLIVLHHPNCLIDKVKFESKVRGMLEKINQDLQDRY
jgi:hypothetical protein